MFCWLLIVIFVALIFSAHKLPALKGELKELADKGYMVIPGRVSRKYFEERFYGVVNETEEKEVQHASE